MRKALYILLALLLLGGAGIFLALHYVDLIVTVALEHYGPQVAGVSVKAGGVRISPREGHGRIAALEIGNPPGYSSPRAARFGEIRVRLDPATVLEPVVRVHELAVDAPQITVERRNDATNLEVIQKSIEAYARGAAGDGGRAGERTAGKRRFIVERLSIRRARVSMTSKALGGQAIGFDLPDIELTGVGRREGGLTASEVAAVVASALQNRIAQRTLTSIELLRRGGAQGALDALKGLLR
ncbi:MAG TPA: hypothetical protein VFK48_17600 [Usitatibacter sp.]|nr:hypothetical protein [Usitatibacter sp.]